MLPTLEQSTVTTFSCFTLHVAITITINTSSYDSQRMCEMRTAHKTNIKIFWNVTMFSWASRTLVSSEK